MKVVILAGGLGTRLSEETDIRPKPMVEIGGKPILWHIIQYYRTFFPYCKFIICTGYKGKYIIDWFEKYEPDFFSYIKLVDTGQDTMTGGRIKRIEKYIDEPFMLTYGDGVSNIDLNQLLSFHKQHKGLCTVTAVQPQGRWGGMNIDSFGTVNSFVEKPKSWINGGYFVCEPEIFSYIKGDDSIFELDPINKLVEEGNLKAYQHYRFWKCMDTLKDKNDLNQLWNNNPPWKIW